MLKLIKSLVLSLLLTMPAAFAAPIESLDGFAIKKGKVGLTSDKIELRSSGSTGKATLKYQDSVTTTPIITIPTSSGNDSAVLRTDTATLTNKTLTTPTINGGALSGTFSGSPTFSGTPVFSVNPTLTAGAGSGTFQASGTLNRSVTQVATGANTTETDGGTYTLPANTLNANGKSIRVRVWGATGATANNKTVQLYWGGTSVYTTGAVAANNKDWYLEMLITRTGAGAQTILITGHFNGAVVSASTRTTATKDETTALVIKNTMTNGTAAASDVITNGFEVTHTP